MTVAESLKVPDSDLLGAETHFRSAYFSTLA